MTEDLDSKTKKELIILIKECRRSLELERDRRRDAENLLNAIRNAFSILLDNEFARPE